VADGDYDYDVALSFAGEDREYVEEVARILHALGVRVFYDKYETTDLWGKDLYTHLDDVYRKRSKYCVMFVSAHYREKLWTSHERQSAQARAFESAGQYVLPVRLTTLNYRVFGPQQVIYRRLRAPTTSFIWAKRSPVSGDLLLSLAALSIPAMSRNGTRRCQLVTQSPAQRRPAIFEPPRYISCSM